MTMVVKDAANYNDPNDLQQSSDMTVANTAVTSSPSSSPRTARARTLRNYYVRRTARRGELSRRQGKGVRVLRRLEQEAQLVALAGEDEDVVPLFEPSISAFRALLDEHDKMQVWNDFINRSEEEQERVVVTSQWEAEEEVETLGDDLDRDLDDELEVVEVSAPVGVRRQVSDCGSWCDVGEDSREVHPAFSAQEAFSQIDYKIRSYLQQRHVPLGYLAALEEHLAEFFAQMPESVYVTTLSSSFERMLVHAQCQYLGLRSRSVDVGGVRNTIVENTRPAFSRPEVSLVSFLQTLH